MNSRMLGMKGLMGFRVPQYEARAVEKLQMLPPHAFWQGGKAYKNGYEILSSGYVVISECVSLGPRFQAYLQWFSSTHKNFSFYPSRPLSSSFYCLLILGSTRNNIYKRPYEIKRRALHVVLNHNETHFSVPAGFNLLAF